MLSNTQRDAFARWFLSSYGCLMTIFFGIQRPLELGNVVHLALIIGLIGLLMDEDSRPQQMCCIPVQQCWPNDQGTCCCEEESDEDESEEGESEEESPVEKEEVSEVSSSTSTNSEESKESEATVDSKETIVPQENVKEE